MTLRPFAALLLLSAPALADDPRFDTSAGPVEVATVTEDLQRPWGFEFLPGGGVLITEKEGTLRIWRNGALTEVSGAPDVNDSGQGGLLDVALAADFETSGEIYLSYAASVGLFDSQTRIARARLAGDRLEDLTVIFRQEPAQTGGRHFGSRIAIAPDGSVVFTVGDRGERPEAQNLTAHQGSVLRILRDGAPHPDNPFIGNGRGWREEIYSYGHRNPQGADFTSAGVLYTVEHGARGGDEVNRPEAGKNYGWPTISYGRHYSGAKIGVGQSTAGMEQPEHYWDPSIAPSGLLVYEGEMFPEWRGDIFVGALKFELISRLDMEGGVVRAEERLFADEFGRIRDVKEGPEGAIWFITDAGGLHRVARP